MQELDHGAPFGIIGPGNGLRLRARSFIEPGHLNWPQAIEK